MPTSTRHLRMKWTAIACLLGAGWTLAPRAPLDAQSPGAQPLVQKSGLNYLGAFNPPAYDGYLYGGAGLTYNPARNSLFISGWVDDSEGHGSAEITIPEIGGTATFLQPMSPSLEGGIVEIGDDGVGRNIGGQLVYRDRLYLSAFLVYDAEHQQRLSLFSRPLSLDSRGQVIGPSSVGPLGAGFYSGYMAHVPEGWQGSLRAPAVIGQCCLSIVSRTSYGPALFAFDPEQLGRATPLVYYDSSHQTLGEYGRDGSHPMFNGTTRVTGVVLPDGTASALFFGTTGIGPWCYGEGSECGDVIDQATKGDHAYPYRGYVWAYDLNDLAAVRAGARRPWQVKPYTTWELSWTDVANSFGSGGAAYDPSTRRIYVLQVGAGPNGPLIHVYRVATGDSSSSAVAFDR